MHRLRLFWCFLCIYSGFALYAQDKMVLRNNATLTVKVLEVGPYEIIYRLFDDATKTDRVQDVANVAYIVYQNGYKQEFKVPPPKPGSPKTQTPVRRRTSYSVADSLQLFKYSESVSVNFCSFINSEFGVVYQKENVKKHYSLMIPFGIGVDEPWLTQRVYFKKYFAYEVGRKIIEGGIGINYFPTYRNKVNYFIGPCVKVMQYEGKQIYMNPFQIKNSSLTRICGTITNGLLFRGKSRLQATIFGSIGFSGDFVVNKIENPYTKKPVNPILHPYSMYFWGGFMVGFCF